MNEKKAHSYSILIVCLGNICRSPMAEALLKKELEPYQERVNFIITSAGFLHTGEPASQPAEQLMMEWGLNISRHLSTRLTRKLVASQDLILTMEEEQAQRIRELNESDIVISSIVSYASNGKQTGDIEDPYGYPMAKYEEVANKLKLLVQNVAKRLLNVLTL